MDAEFDLNIKTKGTKLPDSLQTSVIKPKRLASWFRENKVNTKDRNIADLNNTFDKGAFVFKSKEGKGLDELARDATEEGYFDVEPTESQFIQAVKDDLDGVEKYKSQDFDLVEAKRDFWRTYCNGC